MIERYTLPEMGAIWTDEARMQAWLDVEIAAVKAWNRLGKIPDDAVKEIEAKAAFDVARVNEIEQTTNHDVIAFLTNVAEYVGDASKYVHYGMTSSDMLDTALALQIKRAGQLLERDLVALGEVLKRRAFEFRDTVEVGRTHGIHAEPITFGMKLGIWAFEVSRHLKRMRMVTVNAPVGKISGAVGAYNNIDPRVEDLVCEELGIGREPISNQVVQRDRHAEFLTPSPSSAPASRSSPPRCGTCSAPRCARRRRRSARARRAPRPCPTSATPSSASAWRAARACCAATRWSAWRTWRCGTSATSATARPSASCCPTAPSCSTTCCRSSRRLVDNLVVDEERMLANLGQSYRLVFSGAVLLALVDKGMLRDDAYRVVQDAAMQAWRDGVDFGDLIKASAEAMARHDAGGDRRRHGPGPVPRRPRRDLRAARAAGVLSASAALMASGIRPIQWARPAGGDHGRHTPRGTDGQVPQL